MKSQKLVAGAVLMSLLSAFVVLQNGPGTPPYAEAAQKQKAGEKKGKTFRRRLPNYYGQVGISKKQRETIYRIQKEYFDQISVLEVQIAALKAKRDGEVHNVLNDPQKAVLKQLVDAAKKKRAANAKKKKQADEDDK